MKSGDFRHLTFDVLVMCPAVTGIKTTWLGLGKQDYGLG